MCIGEPHPFTCQTIDVGGRDEATVRIVTLNIAVAQVIGVNDQNVGSGCRKRCFVQPEQAAQDEQKGCEMMFHKTILTFGIGIHVKDSFIHDKSGRMNF